MTRTQSGAAVRRFGLVLVLAFLAGGCLRAQFERDNRLRPIAEEDVERLVPGESRLDECLAVLGAPLFVRERQTYGAELAYGWSKRRGWRFAVSVPLSDYASASFDYDEIDEKLRGAVLLFDEDWTLEVVRTGYLRDLVAREVVPAYLEADEADEADESGERDS